MPSNFLPDGLEVDLSVEAGDWPPEETLRYWIEKATAASVEVADLEPIAGSEISFVFTDDVSIRKLNREWRDKDKPTNVLSFPGSDPEKGVYGPLLGDVVFAFETVRREADEMGIEFHNHLTHLTIHGVLHLFDYDHQDEEEAEVMETIEKAILASLNIDDPYADRPLAADLN